MLFLWGSKDRGIHGVFAEYSWGIHGVFICIGYVSVMYRLCIGTDSEFFFFGGASPTLLTTIVFNKIPERPMCCFGRNVVEKKVVCVVD